MKLDFVHFASMEAWAIPVCLRHFVGAVELIRPPTPPPKEFVWCTSTKFGPRSDLAKLIHISLFPQIEHIFLNMSEIGGMDIHKHGRKSDLKSMKTMLEEIFALSPVESLLQYKSISKFWNGLICSPEFKRVQLRCSRKNMKYIICPYTGVLDGVSDVCLMDSDGDISNIITLPGFAKSLSAHMVSSFNGLLCFANETEANDLDIYICNPITKKLLILPKGSPSVVVPSAGIAFDPGNGQYKAFRLFRDKVEPGDEGYACEVYSSGSGSWRGIGGAQYRPTYNPHCPTCADHVCVGGSAFWFCWSKEDPDSPACILSVDMKEEKFKTINFPEDIKINGFSFLIDLDGRLSLVTVDSMNYCLSSEWDRMKKTYIDVWVLEDLHPSSWSHKTFAELQVDQILSFNSVIAIKNEIFFIITDIDLINYYHVYNLDEAFWRILDLAYIFEGSSPIAFPFAESLSPCKCHCI